MTVPMATALLILSSLWLACSDDGGDDSANGDGGVVDTGDAGPIELSASLDVALADECQQVCGTVSATGPAGGLSFAIESDIDGFLRTDSLLDDQGQGSFCVSGLSPGQHRLAVHLDAGPRTYVLLELEVRPFGWAYGLDRSAEPLTELPWVPVFGLGQLSADPVLAHGDDGSWDSKSVLAPSVDWLGDTRLLYYAGTADTEFELGVATDQGDGAFVRYAGNPILTAEETGASLGDWDYYAQNTPEVLVLDGLVWLYYNGRSEEEGGLNIGLATSADGLVFDRVAGNPVLGPTGDEDDFDGTGVAHPSVLVRDVDFTDNDAGASRVFELWYATGTLQVGYALSANGLDFQRYCRGPVFTGTVGSWDQAVVKAPEVVYQDGLYQMTYSGCGQGCFQVGWAASRDGVNWLSHDQPIIETQRSPAWNSFGTQEAFIELDDDRWRFWYAGTGVSHGQIGMMELQPEIEER